MTGSYAQNLAEGMLDTHLELGLDCQGHPSSTWDQANVCHYNLPTIIQMGKDHTYKREDHKQINLELLWYLEMGQLVINSIQPHSYLAAMQAVCVIVQKGTPAVSWELKYMTNPLGIVHGAFDILMHGVSQIMFLPPPEGLLLQQICMAVYSHADVCAGTACFAGMQQEPKVFSHPGLCIPFHPAGFSLTQMLQILKYKGTRLHGKY
ncbi:hypothetical protein DFH28DRAFT_934398 [Melampsora americana]|nr:hypothetical protein DFH28DRAFT_934398 [Melampsora americana]